MTAPFACKPETSRGRLYPQPSSGERDAFQRDRDRIIHSVAFRRLRHKTQVFVVPDGDHFRVRLTHSLEVAQIARSIARALGLNEDLTEALALAHDIGHPPFGHAGEDALEAKMAPYGGFDHNAHTIRTVTRLERRYPNFDGLNLTWETLEGLAKHNGPVMSPTWAVAEYDTLHPLDLHTWPSLEAQVAALADDIAYDNHDIDDGLRAGVLDFDELLTVPFVKQCWDAVCARHPGKPQSRLLPELIRDQIGLMVGDLLAETRRRLDADKPASADEVRAAGKPFVGFSDLMVPAERSLKHFLRERLYRHYKVTRLTEPARTVVAGLFDALHDDPSKLPAGWAAALPAEEPARARHIADFIAGMTDRFALRTYEELVGPSPFPDESMI